MGGSKHAALALPAAGWTSSRRRVWRRPVATASHTARGVELSDGPPTPQPAQQSRPSPTGPTVHIGPNRNRLRGRKNPAAA